MKKINTAIICLILIFSGLLQAQDNTKPSFPQLISTRFARFQQLSFQEKLYLQTDKPYYNAGEEIWFKAYLLHAATHFANTPTRFVYVELIDKADSVFSRVKIRKDSLGCFAGHIKLNPETPAGNYVLRAYSYWMQNAGTGFFFKKSIYIGNSIDDRVQSKIAFGIPVNGKVPVNMVLTNSFKTPLADKKVNISYTGGNLNRKGFTLATGKDGKISWVMNIDSTREMKKFIQVSVDEPGFKYKMKHTIPEFSSDFDMQFFPESGNLLAESLQPVAFKAIGTNGLSVEVEGKVYSANGEEVTQFTSIHKGMGKFLIHARAGETYYAIVKSVSGVEKRFILPQAQAQGIALQLVGNRGKIHYQVINNTSMPDNALNLLIHCRGIAYVVLPVHSPNGQITESLLPNGVVSFSLVDTLGNTYCERLIFVNNANYPVIDMTGNKARYGKREPVSLSLKITSKTGKPAAGNYSISITDSKTVKPDTLGDNILSYLLLSSELKGYIEEPASYLAEMNASQREKTDLLMMTQGWTRFNLPDIVKGKYQKPDYYMEVGQALTGKVLNILNKPVANSSILMLSAYKSRFRTAATDSLGNYVIDGIEFPDSTSFIIKAIKKKSFGDVEVVPDADVFPGSALKIPSRAPDFTETFTDYLQQSKEKYYTEGGMRVINLDELTVTASRKEESAPQYYYDGMASNKITSEKLETYAGMDLLSILGMTPGVQVNGNSISIRGSSGNPLFLIDGIETDNIDDIIYLSTSDIDNISVFKGVDASIFGSRGGNGAIAITLKRGTVVGQNPPPSLATTRPLGYQKPAEFYSPKYETDSVRMLPKSDLRTTIYWNPRLVADSTGLVQVEFFTADKANNYSIIFEGVTEKGEICRYVGILRRE